MQPLIAKARSRLLAFELIEEEPENKTARPPAPSDRFRSTIYDYTNNRAITAEGSVSNARKLQVTESSRQPFPTDEEFDEAVTILAKDPGIGPALREKSLQPYAPMPPLIESRQPDGRIERTVAVGEALVVSRRVRLATGEVLAFEGHPAEDDTRHVNTILLYLSSRTESKWLSIKDRMKTKRRRLD